MSVEKDKTTSKRLLDADADTPENLRRRGLELFNNGDGNLIDAGKILEKAARKGVTEPGEFWYALGICRHALWEQTWDDFVDEDGDGVDDRIEEVVGALRRALNFPEMTEQPKIFLAAGKAYEDYGSFDGAMQMYSHIISGFPKYEHLPSVILRAAALCRHPRVNALDQATTYFEYLLDNPPPPYTPARLQFILAGCYQRQGRSNLARDMFSDVLKQDFEEKRKQRVKSQASSTADSLLGGLRPTLTKSSKIPNVQTWMSDPNMWRERAQFHYQAGVFALAVDDMSQTLRVSGNQQQHEQSKTPEWKDWELLAISLGRINEKESALKALERAFNFNPWAEPTRLRQRIARWDPAEWGVKIALQEKAATKCTAFFRGRIGSRRGHVMMEKERQRRAERDFAATTIQCAYRFQLFRRRLRRQREVVRLSLGRIAKRRQQYTLNSWSEFVDLVQYHRAKRNRAAVSIKLWFFYERIRFVRKKRRAHNRNAVARALEQMRTRIKRTIVKAWEGYVVWIIDVKEPYNATTIECWWKHLKWAKEFHRKRTLVLKSLQNIRLHFYQRLFHHLCKCVQYQKMVRKARRHNRLRDRFRKCFLSWKWWTHEFRPWWEEAKEERAKERYYAVKRATFRYIGSDNTLRVDPVNSFTLLGLASVGVAMAGGRDSTLDTTSTEAKLARMDRYPGVVKKLRRSIMTYEKVCRLWREYYANREESQGVSFMHARLPKDSFDRAHLGSVYYKGIVQTALMKQELDRFRLHKVPLDRKLQQIMPGPRNKKPKTVLGTLFDKEREMTEAHFVRIHRQAIAEASQNFGAPQTLGLMALTLPNALRKQVKNFKPPGKMISIKASRLTGKNKPISLFNLVPPAEEKSSVLVDRVEEESDDDDNDNNVSSSLTDEFGNDDPQAILKQIMEEIGAYDDPASMTTNRHAWGFPEYVRPGVYGVEGAERLKSKAANDTRIARGEWARMAREEIEQRETDAHRLRKAREDDYHRFAKASNVCGPMSELDFFCSLRPGRMYEQRAYVSAVRIQLWSLIWIPRRYSNRLEASIHIQRMCRGHLARYLLSTLLKVKRNVLKLLTRGRDKAFRKWWTNWHGKKMARKMLVRLLKQQMARSFDQWTGFVCKVHEGRIKKLADVYQKLRNAKLNRHFCTWADYVPQAKRIRRLMWKVMASNKHYLFDTWANNVEDILEDRKDNEAARVLQRVCRGWLGRMKWSRRFHFLTKIVCLLQPIIRGHIGRVLYKWTRKRKRDLEIRALREKRIRAERGSYDERIQREKTRRYMESMFIEEAARMADMASSVKKKSSKKKIDFKRIQSLSKEIQSFGKANALFLEASKNDVVRATHLQQSMVGTLPVPIKYLSWPLLSRKTRKAVAARWVRCINRSNAAMIALTKFRSDRPPPYFCEHCLETFVEERDLEHHERCHSDKSHWIFTPEAFYEFGFAESGGKVHGKRKPRERRVSSYIGAKQQILK